MPCRKYDEIRVFSNTVASINEPLHFLIDAHQLIYRFIKYLPHKLILSEVGTCGRSISVFRHYQEWFYFTSIQNATVLPIFPQYKIPQVAKWDLRFFLWCFSKKF